MSTSPQKDDVAQDKQQQEQEQENHIQDTEMDADNQTEENNTPATTKEEEEEKKKEENVVTTETETVEISVQTATQKTPTETSQSSTKRKLDARDSRAEPSNNEHQKTKKDRATKLMKVSATKKINQNSTKTREFSFARPTESSARRTAALSENHAKNMKATPPSYKLQQLRRTPAKAQCASMPVYKTPTATAAADKASRSHFSYTPYTGPLPPLTVESSFAPKNGQSLDRRAWSASPAQTKGTAATRKPRLAKETQLQSTPGKENNGVNKEKKTATNAASSSQTPVTPGKSELPVSEEENWSSSKEKDEAQRSLAQHARSISPVPSSATAVEPTV